MPPYFAKPLLTGVSRIFDVALQILKYHIISYRSILECGGIPVAPYYGSLYIAIA